MHYTHGDPVYIGKEEAKDLPPTDDSVAEIGFKVTAIKIFVGNQEQGIRIGYLDEFDEVRSKHILYSPMSLKKLKRKNISNEEEVVGLELTKNDDGEVISIDFICLKKD